jgi:mono/diheme cytochrome c family protein
VAVLLAACSLAGDVTPPPGAPAVTAVTPAGTASTTNGAAIFAQHCSGCHGPAGKGDGELAAKLMAERTTPLPDFSSPDWQSAHSPEALFQIVTDGRLDKLMPPWRDKLTEAERWAVVDFIETLADSTVASVPAPGNGTELRGEIHGQVINGTSGGTSLNGLTVVLHGYDSFSEAQLMTTSVGAEGTFIFADVPYVAGRSYLLTASHSGLAYSSDLLNFDKQSKLTGLRLTVYDTTTDPALVEIERMHLTFDYGVGAGQVSVAEMLLLSNTGDKTFAPLDSPVLAVSLTPGATGVAVLDGQNGLDITTMPTQILVNSPLRPGAAQVSFEFRLPYAGSLRFTQSLAFRVRTLNVMLPAGNVRAEGDGLQYQGTQSIQTGSIRVYAAQDLAANQAISFSVSGRPDSAATGGSAAPAASQNNWSIWLTILAILLVSAGVAGYVQRLIYAGSGDTYDDLLQTVADLDDAFEAGRIEALTYERRRAQLKARIVDLAKHRPKG